MPGQPPAGPVGPSNDQMINIAWGLLGSLATIDGIFLHSHMGKREPGLKVFVAVAIILAFFAHEPFPELIPFTEMWLVAALFRRLETFVDRLRGNHQLTDYPGYPWLCCRLAPFLDERHVKLLVEPPLAFGVGAWIATTSHGLGSLVMASAAAMGLRQAILLAVQRASDDAENDARLLMQQRKQGR